MSLCQTPAYHYSFTLTAGEWTQVSRWFNDHSFADPL